MISILANSEEVIIAVCPQIGDMAPRLMEHWKLFATKFFF